MHKNGTEGILVVDDEKDTRDLISCMLVSEGYDCITSADGYDALSKLSTGSYAVVLLDYKMPGLSGEEVLMETVTLYPDTAIVMVTGITDLNIVVKLMKSGAYDYLVKPFTIDMLLASVNRALGKRSLLIEKHNNQVCLEKKVNEQTAKIRNNLFNSITSLAFALEAKDKYTSGHSQRVSRIAVAIAEELGLEEEKRDQIRFAGLVHDIGKIGTSEVILHKNGELTDEEYLHVTSHSTVGERILKPVVENTAITLIVRHHHERYDGQGYPDGLKGEQIPLGPRILAVADTYDAMTSNRPYRSASSHQIALKELELKAGSQFDPEIVRALCNMKVTDSSWLGSDQLEPDLVANGTPSLARNIA